MIGAYDLYKFLSPYYCYCQLLVYPRCDLKFDFFLHTTLKPISSDFKCYVYTILSLQIVVFFWERRRACLMYILQIRFGTGVKNSVSVSRDVAPRSSSGKQTLSYPEKNQIKIMRWKMLLDASARCIGTLRYTETKKSQKNIWTTGLVTRGGGIGK